MGTAIHNLRETNYNLQRDLDSFQRTSDFRDAFARGVQRGRSDQMTQDERFAKSWEDRKVEFRGQKAS